MPSQRGLACWAIWARVQSSTFFSLLRMKLLMASNARTVVSPLIPGPMPHGHLESRTHSLVDVTSSSKGVFGIHWTLVLCAKLDDSVSERTLSNSATPLYHVQLQWVIIQASIVQDNTTTLKLQLQQRHVDLCEESVLSLKCWKSGERRLEVRRLTSLAVLRYCATR